MARYLYPIIYIIDILCMIQFKLQGSDATALIGGTTVIMIIIISLIAYKGNGLNKTTDYFIEGLNLALKFSDQLFLSLHSFI